LTQEASYILKPTLYALKHRQLSVYNIYKQADKEVER